MANPTTYFGWVMPTATDLVTDLPADFAVFGQGVDTSMQFLLGGTTGQVLSKTSGTNMAFTWVTAQVGDITGVTAGTGISGGGTGGDVTISINTAVTADLTTAQTLTNKKLSDSTTSIVDVTDATKAVKFDVGGTTAITGTIATNFTTAKTITIPDATDTLVGRATTDTLTNKTLTSPALTTPTISTLTTNGDLVYGTGSGALSRLGIGSAAQVLTVASGIPSWATPAASASGLTLITTSPFTTVSSHSINSCFSASYVFYEVRIMYTAASASPEVSMRMRVSGTDATTNYALTRLYAYGSTSGFDANAGLGTGSLWTGGAVNGYADRASTRLSIGTPFQAAATTIYVTSCYQNGTANQALLLTGSGAHATQTSYDGFTIMASTGTVTGTVYVYGLAV